MSVKNEYSVTETYVSFLGTLKARIHAARLSASRAVNQELILLYWDIGQEIVEKLSKLGWGESVIDRLSQDLIDEFPEVSGFSPRNLRDMKRFFVSYSSADFWRQAVAKIPWGHHYDDLKQNYRPACSSLLPTGNCAVWLES